MEHTAIHLAGQRLVAISDAIASAWLDTKTMDVATSHALYAVATDFDTEDLIGEGSKRVLTAIERLLASAADAHLETPASVAFVLRTVLGGTVRTVLERGATAPALTLLRTELPILCRAYLLAKRNRSLQIRRCARAG